MWTAVTTRPHTDVMDMTDEDLVAEVTDATESGHQASKTFPNGVAAAAAGQEWRDRLRRVLPPDTITHVGILVDGDRVVLFDAPRWIRGELDLDIKSSLPVLHVDPRLMPGLVRVN
jgi:hypothetical protein